MKKILRYIGAHISSDFNWSVYIYTTLFLLVCIHLNYKWDFEDSVLDSYLDRPVLCVLYYFLFYALGYYGIIIPKLIFTGQAHKLTSREFWIKTLFFLGVLSFSAGYNFANLLSIKGYYENRFIQRMFLNSENLLIYIICFTFFIKFFEKRASYGLYGLHLKNINIKPYFILLLMMFPIILWASFQSEFISYYPIFKVDTFPQVFGFSKKWMFVIQEFFYSLDFIATELIFRGAFVIGLSYLLDKHSVLPMASLYAFLHFGKPMPETIGSIFGGYILGVLALRTQNIWGGCFVHVGIAMMMDVLALLQKGYLK